MMPNVARYVKCIVRANKPRYTWGHHFTCVFSLGTKYHASKYHWYIYVLICVFIHYIIVLWLELSFRINHHSYCHGSWHRWSSFYLPLLYGVIENLIDKLYLIGNILRYSRKIHVWHFIRIVHYMHVVSNVVRVSGDIRCVISTYQRICICQ